MDKYLSISEEVKTALMDNRPVVALESTIIAHGMPYPENVVTAKSLEETITNNYILGEFTHGNLLHRTFISFLPFLILI